MKRLRLFIVLVFEFDESALQSVNKITKRNSCFNFFHLQLKYLGSSWISSIYYCLMWLEIKQISNTICYCIDLFNSRRKWLRIYLMPFYWIFSLCCRVLLAAAKIPKILISSMKIKTKHCVLLDLWWVTHLFNKCQT